MAKYCAKHKNLYQGMESEWCYECGGGLIYQKHECGESLLTFYKFCPKCGKKIEPKEVKFPDAVNNEFENNELREDGGEPQGDEETDERGNPRENGTHANGEPVK